MRQALEALPYSDRVTLQKMWLDSFGREPHPKLRKDLMIPILAYRIQKNAYGGLKPATKRRLLKIAAAIEDGSEPDLSRKPQIKQGIRIVRVWRDETHQVTVTSSGFECSPSPKVRLLEPEGSDHESTDPSATATHVNYIAHHNGLQYFGYQASNLGETQAHLKGLGDFLHRDQHQRSAQGWWGLLRPRRMWRLHSTERKPTLIALVYCRHEGLKYH